jgi:hypothetical protein
LAVFFLPPLVFFDHVAVTMGMARNLSPEKRNERRGAFGHAARICLGLI